MIETMFLVPVRDNDGVPFSLDDWAELELRLIQFNGFTVSTGVSGVWRSQSGEVHRDESKRYEVSLESWRAFPAWLEVVEWVRIKFRQEALYIRVAGTPEILE